MAPKPAPAKATGNAPPPARPPVKRSNAHPMDRAPVEEAPPAPPVPAAPAEAPVAGTGAPATPPTVEQVQATPASERRQLNVGVPKILRLHRRAGLYAEDHGVSRQDQVAVALDAWLREHGY